MKYEKYHKKLDSIIDILHSHLYFVKDGIIEKIANEIVVLDFPTPKGCSADCMYCKHFKKNGIWHAEFKRDGKRYDNIRVEHVKHRCELHPEYGNVESLDNRKLYISCGNYEMSNDFEEVEDANSN